MPGHADTGRDDCCPLNCRTCHTGHITRSWDLAVSNGSVTTRIDEGFVSFSKSLEDLQREKDALAKKLEKYHKDFVQNRKVKKENSKDGLTERQVFKMMRFR